MTCAAAALLTAELLGGVGDFASVLGLGGTLTLVGEVLDNVEPHDMLVRSHAKDFLIKDDGLSRLGAVYFQYVEFHNLMPPKLHKSPWLPGQSPSLR